MKTTALGRFEREFRGWVEAHNNRHGYGADADEMLALLGTRISDEVLRQIGSGLINGWLVTEEEPGRGYYVRERDRPGVRGGQYTLTHVGDGTVAPCWELYVQLGDYAQVRTVAERFGQEVRLEDHLMDLTVYADSRLVLYVEQKRNAGLASELLRKVEAYGQAGFAQDDYDRNNDALRKAKYLVRDGARPLFFGLSAVGYRRLFSVTYEDRDNRFRLEPLGQSLTAPLSDYPAGNSQGAPRRSCVDPLACEVEALVPEIWVTLGTGRTAYNFYAPCPNGDAIIAGVYADGSVWTDLSGLGAVTAERLAAGIAELGIDLEPGAQWRFWRSGDERFDLAGSDPTAIAQAFRKALDGA